MGLSIESKNVMNVHDGGKFSKQETVGPSSSLLHEELNSVRTIGVSLGINDEISSESMASLIVDILSKKSIFYQVFVCLPASWFLLHINELEELTEWFSLDCLISEHTVAT